MVHTTIRKLAREAEVRGWLQVDNSRLKFFAADLMSDAGWADAVAGCSHVAHVASPLPSNAPDMGGERCVAAGPFMGLRDIGAILKANLGRDARKVPSLRVPDFVVRLLANFDPLIKQVVGERGNVRDNSAQHAFKTLSWKTRDVRETIRDTAREMVRLGIVKV